MTDLRNFLHSHRIDSNKKPSHVSLIYPKGKFFIPEEDQKTFWDLYSQSNCEKGIAEMPISSFLPILVDVDLKKEILFNNQFLEQRILYNLDHVKTLVNIYQNVLSDILQDLDDRHKYCFLLEKKAYIVANKDKTILKNGFHLHFPYIFINKSVHENELLPRIRLELKKLKAHELPNNSDNCIDKNYIKTPWLLYGSQKENGEPYIVKCAFDSQSRVIEDWHNIFEDYQLYDCSGVKTNIDVVNIDKYLPQIFSIIINNREDYAYDVRQGLPALEIVTNKSAASLVKTKKIQQNTNFESINGLVEKLLNCLSEERADDRNCWMQVGWILYNIYNGSKDGYDRWVEFSKRSEKCQESICSYEWNKMSKKDLTIGSLKYLAKEDNPSLYDSIITEYTSALCDKCLKLEGTHTDLANLLFQKYEAEFVCASMSNKVWFQFKDHIWQRIDEGYSLRKRISGELVDEYEKKLKTIIDQTEDDDARQKKLNSAMKLIKSLKSSPFKNHIMKEAMEVFYNSNFLFYLDNDPYLIAFYNGVYDIKNHVFREGRPDDYISLKMNISYNNKYTETCKEVLEVFSFFEKIFPDQELRDYFLDSVAELFIGGNFNKIVQIWTGEGDNGKSITQMIFEQMLGPYNIKLPTSLITGKRTQSSAACPELVRAGNGVRLAMLQEPDKKDCINIGVLKELSGNDTFFARGLYKEGQEITPMFKLVLICNEPPKLPYSDKATWNRIKLIPFESTFTNDYPESIEDQFREKKFPKDEQFKDKIPKMLEPLAWYLLHRLKTKPKMKHEPLKVIIATQNFKKKNDIFKQFMDECIIEDKGKMVRNADMYGAFKDWHHESCPHTSCPDKNEFFDYFIRLWGPYNSDGCWSDKSLHGLFDLQ